VQIFSGVTTVTGYPHRDNVLLIPRGLPGSGKSTALQNWKELDPQHREVLGRDDWRKILGCLPVGKPHQEAAITLMMTASVEALLRHGWDVGVDATHIQPGTLEHWTSLAEHLGVRYQIVDFTHISPEECIRRDLARRDSGGRYVTAKVINAMNQRYLEPSVLARQPE